MKNAFIMVSLFAVLGLVSCNQTELISPEQPGTSDRISKIDYIVTHQAWIIENFWNAGEDITAKFKNYIFEFDASGSVKASNGRDTRVGHWYTKRSEGGTWIISMKFDDSAPFNAFTHEWSISNTFLDLNTTLQLQDLRASKHDSYFLALMPI